MGWQTKDLRLDVGYWTLDVRRWMLDISGADSVALFDTKEES